MKSNSVEVREVKPNSFSSNAGCHKSGNGVTKAVPPPRFESFALDHKPRPPKVVIKMPTKVNSNVVDADDVHLSVVTAKELSQTPPPPRPAVKLQTSFGAPTCATEASSTSRRQTRPPARARSYVFDEEDEEEAGARPAGKNVSSAPQDVKASRRRQLRVIDDSSDEEYDPAAEKTGTAQKRLRRTIVDDPDDDLEEDHRDDGIINLDDDEITGDPKDVLRHTLAKCDKIATVLRSELHDDSQASSAISAPKVVTEAQVRAACQMAGSRGHMLNQYQLVGVNFLLLLFRKRVGGAILADEMGLGKTVQAIVFLALIKHLDGDSGPHLIVTPASVLENWQRELAKWCPAFKVVSFHGTERNYLKDELHYAARSGASAPFNVFLTGYSLFERKSASSKDDRSMLRKWKWSCVLMDEAHLLKDRGSYRNKHLRSVAQGAKHRLMITGTPLQNDLQELWSLMEFTMPNIFKNCEFDAALDMKNGRKVVTNDNMDLINQLKSILSPFVLRRVKADVMHQLIPKTHKLELLDMVDVQSSAYNKALEEYRELAKSSALNGSSLYDSLPRRQISSIFTHLRKLANHPLLVRRVYTNKDIEKLALKCFKGGIFGGECTLERIKEELSNYNDYTLHKLCISHNNLTRQVKLSEKDVMQSAKCQVLAKLLPGLRDAGHRPLIFSQWTGMLDILEWVLQVMNLKYNRLDGGTQVAERQSLVDDFNNDKHIFAFLLSTRAGGQGLNLTGADTVIIHDVDFNPQMDRQAEDRCHRIGQSKPVTVYRLVTKLTVDENIHEIAKRKLILDAVLEGDVSTGRPEDVGTEAKTMGQILNKLLMSK